MESDTSRRALGLSTRSNPDACGLVQTLIHRVSTTIVRGGAEPPPDVERQQLGGPQMMCSWSSVTIVSVAAARFLPCTVIFSVWVTPGRSASPPPNVNVAKWKLVSYRSGVPTTVPSIVTFALPLFGPTSAVG